MIRQSTTPVQFQRTIRSDDMVTMTSGRAGKVVPLTYIPLLRGDSASGRVGVDVELAEMPRPLLNAVVGNFQAWFVPKSASPRFSGYDEFMHAYHGENIKALGSIERMPPPFYAFSQATLASYQADLELFKTLGIHLPDGGSSQTAAFNHDLIDAFVQIYNFRLAAHSSRLTRRQYAEEDLVEACALPPAFWPSGRFSRVVPDYERALIVGNLDFDVAAGQIPVSGIGPLDPLTSAAGSLTIRETGKTSTTNITGIRDGDASPPTAGHNRWGMATDAGYPAIFAEMEGQTVSMTLADIDKARETQAFARMRAAMAGNDSTGFANDDALLAELMQGFNVPDELYKRPWLLDSQRVPFGMAERFATDGASLDQSVSQGRASATLSLNVPANDVGGVIIVTCEVIPERLDERQSDEWLLATTVSALPDALRDTQRVEPVDNVLNRRLDARHTTPGGVYGYEPMNDVWNRAATRLGGAFYQADPSNPFTEQRSAIWQTSIVDPSFTADHWIVPDPFPHEVFSDTTADAFEVVTRHSVKISGMTQIGDILHENNDDYDAISE